MNNILNNPEFMKWFGKSIARERMISSKENFQNKKPLVLYHGTNFDFSKFEKGRSGYYSNIFGSFLTKRHAIFFSESPEMASEFGKSVIPVYIKAEEPLDLTTGLDVEDEQKLEKSGFNTRIFYYLNNTWELFDDESGKSFVDALKKAGYDSVIFNENIPLKGDSDRGVSASGKETTTWAVFEPTQIKSIYNKGTFNPNSSNISENYFYNLHNLLEQDTEGTNYSYWETQRLNTQQSYILQNQAFNQLFQKGSIIIDYGSGKGMFKNIFTNFNYVDYEPYPKGRDNPDFTDRSGLVSSYEGKASGVVCNLVLNVIDNIETRKQVVKDILNLLKVDGIGYIVTRTEKQVEDAKNKIKVGDGWEIKSPTGKNVTFQKGFSTNELISYVQSISSTLKSKEFELIRGVGASGNARVGIKRIK